MSDVPTPDGTAIQQLQGLFDAPAYVRRGRRVQAAFEELLDRCRRQRDEWLGMVCVETCNVNVHARTLQPGERHTMSAMISLIKP